MRKALIVDMTVVITEGIEIVGLMMIFGAIGMPSAGGDCMQDGGEDTMDTTVFGVQALIGHGVDMVVGLGSVLMIHFIIVGLAFMDLTPTDTDIMDIQHIGDIHLMWEYYFH